MNMFVLSEDGKRLTEALSQILSNRLFSVRVSEEDMLNSVMRVSSEYMLRDEEIPAHIRALIEMTGKAKSENPATDEKE